MKKTIEYYEKQLEKELELMEKHKKNVADLRKEIRYQKGEMTMSAVNELKLNGEEHARFMKLLKQDKKTLMEVIDIVVGAKNEADHKQQEEKETVDENSDERVVYFNE